METEEEKTPAPLNPCDRKINAQARGRVRSMKRNVLWVQNKLEELQFDPVLELVTLFRDPMNVDLSLKASIAKELLSYIAPKQRTVDEDGKAGGDININIIKFSDNNNAVIQQVFKPAAIEQARQLVANAADDVIDVGERIAGYLTPGEES